MKRISVVCLKNKVKSFGIKADVFLSDKKTILQEPNNEYDSERLWNWLRLNGWLMIPQGNNYYSIERREK